MSKADGAVLKFAGSAGQIEKGDAVSIETVLTQLGETMSLGAVARHAEVNRSHLYQLRKGHHRASKPTVAKLKSALAARQRHDHLGAGMMRASYRAALIVAALLLGLDPDQVLASPAAANRPANRAWRQAAMARRLALYGCNVGLGMSQSEAARAAGLTRAAVSLGIKKIEDLRDDAQFDLLAAKLEGWLGCDGQ